MCTSTPTTNTPLDEIQYRQPRPEHPYFLVDMQRERHPYLSALLRAGIAKTLRQGHRVLLMLNRKGYAAGYRCSKCNHIPHCPHCDVPLAIHQANDGTYFGICHICNYHLASIDKCPACGHPQDPTTASYGYGLQQLSDELRNLTGITPLIIDSPKANSLPKTSRLTADIQHARIIIGTSLLLTPPADRSPHLCGIINADTSLTIPDYTASWQAFVQIYRMIASYPDSVHIVQTRDPEHHAIQLAIRHDLTTMQKKEDELRSRHGYPPYTQYARLLYKHDIEETLFTKVNAVYQDLLYLAEKHHADDEIELIPTPPLIYKKYGKYRYTILIRGHQIRSFCERAARTLQLRKKGFLMDWMPGSLIS